MARPMKRLPSVVLLAAVAFATACPPPNPTPTPDPSKSTVAVDRPSGAMADGADRVQITVTVRDTAGDPVAGATVQIAASGTGNTLLQPTSPTDASGVASGSLVTTVAESKSISASISQGTIASTATAVFGPGPVSASSSTVVATPASVVADGVASATVTVTLRDASGNLVPGKNVTLSSTGTQNAFTQPSATDLRGVAVGVIRSTRAESKVITATVDGAGLLQQPSVQFVAASAAKLAFTVPPGTVAATAAITPAVQVEIQDANGNRVAGSSLPVTVSLAGGTSGAVLGGTRTVAAADGVAVFSDLSVDRAGTGYALIAGGPGLGTTTSAAFDVTAGTGGGNHLAFVARPSDTAAGAAISPAVQVALEDSSGNIISSVTAIVTVTLVGQGALSGTTSVATSSGIASFGNLSIDRVQTGATLVASATGFSGATSLSFNVSAGPASRLVFTAQPSSAQSGAAIAPAIQVAVQDALGNTLTGDTRTISLAIGNNPGGATLSGATSAAAVAGVATLSNVRLDKAGSGYTLVASATGVTSAMSAGFDVTPGPASRLSFLQSPPSSVTAGATFTPTVQVAVEDAAGNVVPGATNAVTVALTGGVPGAVLSGALTQAAVGGIATFGGLSVDKQGNSYALSATAAALSSATSSSFSVVAGPPARLAFGQQPTDADDHVAIRPPVTVGILDSQGNLTNSTATVTMSLASNPAGGTLLGATSSAAVAGVATFSNLSIDKVGTYQLGASLAGVTGAASTSFFIRLGGITGTRFFHHVLPDLSIVEVPDDLSAQVIKAYSPDGGGFNVFTGVGTDAGTFSIAGVPQGPYYLQFGGDFIDTSARNVNLGFYQGGRPDVAIQVPGTLQQTVLTGMVPWTFENIFIRDQMQMWSEGANFYINNLDGLSQDGGRVLTGATTFDQVMDYDQWFLGMPLMDASKGDLTYLNQLQAHDAGANYDDAGFLVSENRLWELAATSGPISATVTPGATSVVSAALGPAPQRSLPLDWKLNDSTPQSYGSLRTAMNPRAGALSYTLFIDAIPTAAYGFYINSPDLVIMGVTDNDRIDLQDLQLTLQYGDPFPASWAHFADVQAVTVVPYDVPFPDGGTRTRLESGALDSIDLLPSLSTAPLRPQVSPIPGGSVDGVPFFSGGTITASPTISWTPPTVGAITWYSVRIRKLFTNQSRQDIAQFMTNGTQVKVPPGILTPGYYYIRLGAVMDPNRSIQTAPYEQHWPFYRAQALSGLLQVP